MSTSERPAIAAPHLIRPRLHALLDEGVQRAVTLVQAGPGWGKTTLLAGWAGGRSQRAGWLTLRRRHATVPGFCSGVAAALQAAFPPAAVPGRFGHVSDEAGLRRLTGAFDRPVSLILDDLQAIDGSPASRVLAGLVRRQPGGLRLMLSGRTVPDLPLHVPRATGGLTWISAADLRFDETEAAALISQLREGLPIAQITGMAQGWPLGLRLAAAAAGTDGGEVIGDYLSREVLAGRSAAVRRFLMRTSIVDEVLPELADALTGTTGSRRVLTDLERDTGLVTGNRYHGQLRAELRRTLGREAPDEIAGLHARAARWYADARRLPEALRHAADAADWEYLSRLAVVLAPGLALSRHRHALREAVQRIPPELLPTTPKFVLCAAMLAIFAGDFRVLPGLVARARELLDASAGSDSPDDRVAVATMVDVLEMSAVLRVTGDMPAMVAATGRILDRVRDADPRELPIAPEIRAVAKIMRGTALVWTLDLGEARRYLTAGLTEAHELDMPLTAVNAEGHLALLAYFDGSLREAERRACAAYDQARRLDATGAVQVTAAYLALALVEVERDRLVEAQAVLRNAQHADADPPEATLAFVAVLVRAHLALAGGDHAAAAGVLRQARDESGPTLRAPLLDRWLDVLQYEIDLATGNPGRVVALLPGVDRPSPAELVCLGRALLATGDRRAGESVLQRVAAGPDPLAACSASITLSLAAESRGDTATGAAAAARAVELAAAEDIHRPFRVLGAEHLRLEPAAEPLSEREIEVLRFLPSVLTANEIANELGVSVNTIKAHLRSIYRKLGAARRREAVLQATRAGLL